MECGMCGCGDAESGGGVWVWFSMWGRSDHHKVGGVVYGCDGFQLANVRKYLAIRS